MSTLGAGKLTLMDWAKRTTDAKVDKIAEMLNLTNEILTDMVVIEGNLPTGHKTTMRTTIPDAAWRSINKGTAPSKSSTRQVEFGAGMIEQLGQVDEELLALAKDPAAFRLSENAPQLETISQTLATTIFYGDSTVNSDRFTGFTPYYPSTTAATADNLILGGGSGSDNTSVWLVFWSENTIHGFFPSGSKAGISHMDLGPQLVEDGITTGNKYRAFVDQYKAKMGLAVRDWRFAVRIANIDVTDLATAGDTTDASANLLKLMIQASNKIPASRMGRASWYCNKEVKTALDIKAMDKANVHLQYKELSNLPPVTMFLGIPIRRVDAISNAETLVS